MLLGRTTLNPFRVLYVFNGVERGKEMTEAVVKKN